MKCNHTGIALSLCAALLVLGAYCLAAKPVAVGKKQPVSSKTVKELQEDFVKLKFGMFIHYNMATYKGVQWVAGYPDPSTFDPGGKVDTDAWADAAKAAGMKYAVLTVKHVGGFCLWDSKYTTYDVMHPDCPYKQDLVAQFVKSFTSRGLKVGLYYCWRHPGFDAGNGGKNKGKYKVLPPECDPAKHSLKEQIEFQKKQVAELVAKYPDAFYIWNDALDPDIMPAKEAKKFIRSLGPNIIASGNWWDWSKKGTPYLDLTMTELRHCRERQKEYKYVAGETCWGLERKWFSSGGPTRDAANVIHHIITANGRKKNLLLNVGPDKKGKINPASVKVLNEVGKMWIPINEILSQQSSDK
jgi:alpha-L-fucosidase